MSIINQHQTLQEYGSTHLKSVFNTAKNDIVDEYESDFVEECSHDSSSISETFDDATSSSLLYHDGPLYELSELMAELPIKRGLSKYYQGKSESFGSLANFKSIEDIAKKRSQRSRTSKCKSQSQRLSAKGKIVKNKKCCSSSVARSCLVSSLEI